MRLTHQQLEKVIMNACCVQATHNASFDHIERTDRSDDKLAMEKKPAQKQILFSPLKKAS